MKELGELVRAAREAKGLTLEQASAETRIRRAYLDALEDGDFRIFPGPAYATGFLRNYASYLGLNSDEVIQTYHAMSPPARISIAPATTVGVERLRRKSRRRMVWSAIAVLLLGLCGYAIKSYSNSYNSAPGLPPATTTGGNPNHLSSRGNRDADIVPNRLIHAHAVIRVHAVQTAWVHIERDGHFVFWGPIAAGTTKKWHGHYLKLSMHRPSAFKVWVDGTRAWHISKMHGHVLLAAGPITWHHSH